ncbi:pyruvate formate-lyase [Solibacillus sp. R5-41]|uniref:pyruvate formate-lyase n=1 Tax=Solibacillus sp. R5-41 TaxID=2048654 RepID=UPI000C1260F0|nr:pyruvate formate-lyase [Solibacillus sp. R5-41]ATP40962.1 pyruvate formate-lyase [Solibacillus sp. R5-41]
MSILFASVVFILLLQLIKQSMDRLHSIILIVFFFIFVQFVVRGQLIPFWQVLEETFNKAPYAKGLLFTAFLLILSELFCELLDQMEYEAFSTVVKLSIRLTLVGYWFNELQPAFKSVMELLERLQ